MKGPIVVGTDGSASAMTAVLEAIELAKALDCELHVISVYRPVPVSGGDLPAEFAGSVNSLSRVEAILEDMGSRADLAGVKNVAHAVTGDPASAIIGLAEELDASLIVVGNKGLGSMRRFLLGNVPSKIVHHSPCSTHIVHTT